MPAILTPSPNLLDQSFPRSTEELKTVAEALGLLQEMLENDDAHLVITDEFELLIDDFEWGNRVTSEYSLLTDIHRLCSLWFLQPGNAIHRINLSGIANHEPHPIPADCSNEGNVEVWAETIGKLLKFHDRFIRNGEFFIGVACPQAFTTGLPASYQNPNGKKVFPLVGPKQISVLKNGFDWEVDSNAHNLSITFLEFKRNFKAIGATHIESPPGSSHYKVHFSGKRPWTLDSNFTDLPEKYLKELEDITGYPLPVIKHALKTGQKPKRKPRWH